MPYVKNHDVESIRLFSKKLKFCGETLDVVTEMLELSQNMPDATCQLLLSWTVLQGAHVAQLYTYFMAV
jgi:hypothetical protein